MNKPIVYLSGPMAGLSVEEANVWRNAVRQHLEPDILCLSPLRGMDRLQGTIQPVYDVRDTSLGMGAKTSEMALTRDFLDTKRSDLILVNLLGASRVSVGTVMEIAWAYALQIPIIVAMEKDNVHRHCLIDESINVLVSSVDDLWKAARSLLLPDVLSVPQPVNTVTINIPVRKVSANDPW